jgi:hypothetical protein
VTPGLPGGYEYGRKCPKRHLLLSEQQPVFPPVREIKKPASKEAGFATGSTGVWFIAKPSDQNSSLLHRRLKTLNHLWGFILLLYVFGYFCINKY